jgi:hypothetical protein
MRAIAAGCAARWKPMEASGDHASAYGVSYAPGSAYYDPAQQTSPAVTTLRAQTG